MEAAWEVMQLMDSHLSHAASRYSFSFLHHRLVLMILTCRLRADGELMTTGWQDRECRKREMQSGDRAAQAREWMTMMMHFRAEEEKAVAYYGRRMKAAQEEVREGLRDDGQRWSEDYVQRQGQAYQEGTGTGCQRRRPGNAVATGRRAATWELGHSRVVDVEVDEVVAVLERRDEAEEGVVGREMDAYFLDGFLQRAQQSMG